MDLWNRTNNIENAFHSTEASVNTALVETYTDVSEMILVYFLRYVSTSVNFILSPLGVTTNIINIIVYWRQGIKDSVNITFISLSVWNLVNCILSCLTEVFHSLDKFAPLVDVDILSLQYVYLGYTKAFLHMLMALITIYLSVERCICIIFPFKVKEIFTGKRVIIVNVVFIMFGVACFSPSWATQGIKWYFDPRTNMTRLDIWLSDNRRDVELFGDVFNGMALIVLAQVLISITTWFMLQGIKNSWKFRQMYTKQEEPGRTQSCNEEINHKEWRVNIFKRGTMMTSKDMKITKVVVLLAMIFFVCNLPIFIASFLRVLFPEIQVNKKHGTLHSLLYSLVFEFTVINCTVNIFVYYNVSSRYRQEFLILFSRSGLIQNRIL